MDSELQGIGQTQLTRSLTGKELPDDAYWQFLLMSGFGDPSKTQELFSTLRQSVSSKDWRMPLIEIGEARGLSIQGRDLECFQRLRAASDIIFSHSNFLNDSIQAEITSLYIYTHTTLQHKINQEFSNLSSLLYGQTITSIDSFKIAYNYRIALARTISYKLPISELVSVLKELEENNLWTLACIGYRAAAIISRKRGDFATSYKLYETSSKIAQSNRLIINLKQLYVSRGYTYFEDKKFKEAEDEYMKIVLDGDLDPTAPILYENLALLAEARADMDTAVALVKQALEVSTRLDSIPHTPDECLYLGQAYEQHYKDMEQAEKYYQLGYEHAMRYASHGVSLTGDRQAVVEAYVTLMKEKWGSPKLAQQFEPQAHFAFSEGKTWKEIKDIFQHQLIRYHQRKEPKSKALAKHLDMPASTLYSVQDRLRKRGYELPGKKGQDADPDHTLFSFIEEHHELSWQAVNQIFENEIMHYLYEKYGYSKQRMAQILKLSYPSIITKTRELTQVNESLLPN